MSIRTYAELKTAVSNWMVNTNLSARIPEFVAIAEGYLNYGIMGQNGRWLIEPLRIRAMETSIDITITSGVASLPTGYLSAKRFYLSASPIVTLDYFPPVDFYSRTFVNQSAAPQAFTVEGNSIMTAPTASATGKMLYYKAFTALSADSDTNWLLTNQPAAYLFLTLYEAFTYQEGGQEESQAYLLKAASVINALNAADKADRASGAVLTMRTGVTP